MEGNKNRSCVNCGVINCESLKDDFPDYCLSVKHVSELETALDLYRTDEENNRLMLAAAEIEGLYYCKLTRVEEIIAVCKKIGARKIGIATCVGLIDEARLFARILQAKGLRSFGVACKVGATDKTAVGIPEEHKIFQGCHESMCNPILQAQILNREKTDFNVIVGLCVGHDSLFIKHSQAPVTTLITKDRVLGHNPAAALYLSGSYYNKLLTKEGQDED